MAEPGTNADGLAGTDERVCDCSAAGRIVGQYTFEEFDQLVKDRGMVSEFSPYEFRIEKE